jgi:hypothetical protein
MVSMVHWRQQVNGLLQRDALACEVLADEAVSRRCQEGGYRWRRSFWCPATTLMAFLLQVLGAEKTLRAAVSALLVQWKARGAGGLPSADPAAYCQARQRVPEWLFHRLCGDLAQGLEGQVGPDGRWHGHQVRLVDGSTVSMPDEAELQKAFPQPEAQKPGCGFPVARLVVMFCWATGAVLRTAIGNLHIAEISLLRRCREEWLSPGDLLVGDRHYGSYVDITQLSALGVFVLFRLHARRPADFRQGKRLGPDDQMVTWRRPKIYLSSFGIPREHFDRLPETLELRMIRISHVPRGFRSRPIVVVTTLLDPLAYPADEIRALYRDRWMAELNLRALKVTLGMEVLHGESLDVVRKEMLMHLLAYNWIRLLMWWAARQHGVHLHRLSFAGTLHRLRAILPVSMVLAARGLGQGPELSSQLLEWIAEDLLPHRPNRYEPRRKKRRPKEYSLLNKPRTWYRLHGDPDAR